MLEVTVRLWFNWGRDVKFGGKNQGLNVEAS